MASWAKGRVLNSRGINSPALENAHVWRPQVPEDPISALLVIELVEGRDLPKMDVIGKADPYVDIHHGYEKKFKSHTLLNTRTPHWNQTFKLLILKSEQNFPIEFNCFDWDISTKNDTIGSAKVDIDPFWKEMNKTKDLWLKLVHPKKNNNRGEIRVKLTLKDKATVESEFWLDLAKHFDTDHSGTIDLFEIIALFEALRSPATDEEIKALFDMGNGGKPMSYEQFYQLLKEENRNAHPLLSKMFPNTHQINEVIWNVTCKMIEGKDGTFSVGDQVLEGGFSTPHQHGSLRESTREDKLIVIDRDTGHPVEEKIPEYIKVAMRLMYATTSGRFVVEHQAKKILHHLSKVQGEKYDNPESRKGIPEFIHFHEIPVEEMLDPPESFKTFNEFFYRKLKPSARKIADSANDKLAVCGADSRLNVFVSVDEATKLWIKGQKFSLKGLLQDDQMAKEYANGSLAIWRLAPQDYHRFHTPVTGTLASMHSFEGTYYTVNPIAIRANVDVYTENKRVRCVLKTPDFGDVIYIAIGATMVGSVNFTKKVGESFHKGDELGYFAFGGSTVIVLFKNGAIKFEDDLIVNSEKPIETLVKLGQPLGRALH